MGAVGKSVALHPYISLFSGGAGLDLAVRLALPSARAVLYVENEISAARILAARIAEGSIDDAPIWSDVRTVPCGLYCGRVAGIVGGFPCVDLSVAGQQAGITGEHSGLWFEFARLIREIQPAWVFIENVPPVLHVGNGGAVLGKLAELGFDAEWGTLSAASVGASHLRRRTFILAYRAGRGLRELRESSGRNRFIDGCGADVADSDTDGWGSGRYREACLYVAIRQEDNQREGERHTGHPELIGYCEALVNPERAERWPHIDGGGNGEPRRDGERETAGGTGERGLGDSAIARLEGGIGEEPKRGGVGSSDAIRELGNAIGEGLEIGRREPGDDGAECEATERAGEPLGFAPGPADSRWPDLLVRCPWLRPAISQAEAERAFRGMADGLADLVVRDRTDALRAIGNGVVPLQAAAMFRKLLRRIP